MEFQDVVRRRRMVRRYAEGVPVDRAVLDRALENATHAPSAGFSQGWGFLVLDTPDDVRRFWAASAGPEAGTPTGTGTGTGTDQQAPSRWLRGLMTAPVVVLPCSSKAAYLERYAEPDKGWTDRDETRWAMPYWHLDTAMASLLVLQTVTDAGLGGCFFGVNPGAEPRLRAEFAIPDAFDPIGVITIGHRPPAADADQGPAGSPARRARTPWTDVVHRGRWGH